jgi:hypothetical protein
MTDSTALKRRRGMPRPWPLERCIQAVATKWGREARHILGDVLYEATLNSELLLILSAQDTSTNPETVVRALTDGRSQIIDEIYKSDG